MRKLLAGLMAAAIALTSVAAGEIGAYADERGLSGKSAMEITKMMGMGWNLGNTFDSVGGAGTDNVYAHEKNWGNPAVTKQLINGVKKAGFNTIRIPVTWSGELDKDYVVRQEFMDRVKTVVDYAYDEDMFVIINIHHEEWLNNTSLKTDYVKIGDELSAIWSQIAYEFADYDEHIIFEGMNEPRLVGAGNEWTGDMASYKAVNYLEQVFVNTVRASDLGYNDERCLMIPGYAASSSSSIMNTISLPTVNGEVCNNLIVSVHCYSPYDFCLSDNIKDFKVNDPSSTSEIDRIFTSIDDTFLSNGIPVVIGETSATAKNNISARENWAYYMGKKSTAYGVPLVIWDNGNNSNHGGESHAYIDRNTGRVNYPTILSQLFTGSKSVKYGSARSKQVAGKKDTSIIYENKTGLDIKKQWDSSTLCLASEPSFYSGGKNIQITHSGSGIVKLVLDSATKGKWWICIDPSKTENSGDKKVSVFTSADISKALKENGITDYTDLRNFSVITGNGSTTIYKVCTVGGKNTVTYIANGESVSGTTTPSFTNLKFEGWYTTKDYAKGTRYTGKAVDKDITVYAKFTYTGKIAKFDPVKKKITYVKANQDKADDTVLFGDVNGDGNINTKDAIIIKRYVAGWNIEVIRSNADVNADGKINTKDAILLVRYVAGWNIKLGN